MKPGDKIVCIDVKGVGKSTPIALTLHNIYTIVEHGDPIGNAINILNDDNEIGQYWKERFISLNKWREQKLNQILDEETF
jgi:hypothetical protein